MKILIEIFGGNIQRIISSEDAEIVIIDYDNIEAGDSVENIKKYGPDLITNNISSVFKDKIKEKLKQLNF